eukprot:6187694-Pleurochrysis_carterae.AAC.3
MKTLGRQTVVRRGAGVGRGVVVWRGAVEGRSCCGRSASVGRGAVDVIRGEEQLALVRTSSAMRPLTKAKLSLYH